MATVVDFEQPAEFREITLHSDDPEAAVRDAVDAILDMYDSTGVFPATRAALALARYLNCPYDPYSEKYSDIGSAIAGLETIANALRHLNADFHRSYALMRDLAAAYDYEDEEV